MDFIVQRWPLVTWSTEQDPRLWSNAPSIDHWLKPTTQFHVHTMAISPIEATHLMITYVLNGDCYDYCNDYWQSNWVIKMCIKYTLVALGLHQWRLSLETLPFRCHVYASNSCSTLAAYIKCAGILNDQLSAIA